MPTTICFTNKDRFHSTAKTVLRKIAVLMGLPKGSYTVRSMLGGPGIMGEAVLHSDHLYVMIPGDWGRSETMFRVCEGQKDYKGGMNNWIPTSTLTNCPEVAAEAFQALVARTLKAKADTAEKPRV